MKRARARDQGPRAELDEGGTYLVVTSANGRTDVSCKGGRLSLGPSNYVLFRHGLGTFGFDQEAGRVNSSPKKVLGHIWLHLVPGSRGRKPLVLLLGGRRSTDERMP